MRVHVHLHGVSSRADQTSKSVNSLHSRYQSLNVSGLQVSSTKATLIDWLIWAYGLQGLRVLISATVISLIMPNFH